MESRALRARRARVLRGSTAATLATVVAALFHVSGGGAVPGPAPLALTLAFAALACIAVAGRGLSPLRIAVSVLLSQAIFHLALSLDVAASGTAAAGHQHAGWALPAGVGESAVPLTADGMWQAHLLAAAVTTAALLAGERVLLAILGAPRLAIRAITRWLSALQPAIPAECRRTAAFSLAGETAWPRGPLARLRLRHRGPPVVLV